MGKEIKKKSKSKKKTTKKIKLTKNKNNSKKVNEKKKIEIDPHHPKVTFYKSLLKEKPKSEISLKFFKKHKIIA